MEGGEGSLMTYLARSVKRGWVDGGVFQTQSGSPAHPHPLQSCTCIELGVGNQLASDCCKPSPFLLLDWGVLSYYFPHPPKSPSLNGKSGEESYSHNM